MLPATLVALPQLPMTPSGKVDRRALPPPPDQRRDGEGFVAPRTPVEKMVAEIWQEILKVDRVGVSDNFFGLGGHSLLATQVVSRIADAFGLRIPLRRVFETATLESLALAVVESLAEGERRLEVAQMLAEVRGLSDEDARRQMVSEAESGEKDSLPSTVAGPTSIDP
jgi:acyl carrier protein